MKTGIKVTGQISSVSTLAGAISGNEIEIKPLQFRNDQILVFKTKGEAVKALSKGFQSLKNDEPEYYKDGGINYSRGFGMSYDAASATIIEMNH
jgi:hypothetical protein